jgi:large subunit ribosomal protein L13
MEKTNSKTEYKIDAAGKRLGRLASDIAAILLGKKSPSFEKNKVANVKVSVVNASKMEISEKKSKTKIYKHYTGFPGGLRARSLEEVAAKKGYGEVLFKAVSGMIHNTRLKKESLKNLIISE